MQETITAFLAACGLDEEAQAPWLRALERVATAHLARPIGAVRVRDARARLLGVHRAIRVDGVQSELPPYVRRDIDIELRAAITDAAFDGGFVLLLGGSSVGKTRTLLNAIQAVLPDWWLIHPDPTAIDTIRTLAAAPTPRTVVWLDELQRYLDRTDGLPAGLVRTLIASGTVTVATLWPSAYTSRTTKPIYGQSDSHAGDRDLLKLAHIIGVPDAFSTAERHRAEALASDRRIRIALDTRDAGITQALAAGPELIRSWQHAPDNQCYGKALITAALDARRVGATAPLSRELLGAAAPGYLSSAQQAQAPSDWLDHGLTYATTVLVGAVAPLISVADGMGRTAGYTVADYLYQHAQGVRRVASLPDTAWQALVDHHHPADTSRLADNAERRGQYRHAENLYRRLGDVDGTDYKLADLLVDHDRIEELRERADAGSWPAADRLTRLLAERGDIAALRQRAAAGERMAARRLAGLLSEQGNLDEAVAILRHIIDLGDRAAVTQLANVLVKLGQSEEAIAVLRDRTEINDRSGESHYLAQLLAGHGHISELRKRADAGNYSARDFLAQILVETGSFPELRQHADAGDFFAANRLADWLVEEEDLDALRQLADAREQSAASERLAKLLAIRGEIEELRKRADIGDGSANSWFAESQLALMLAARGEIVELRKRAESGNANAVICLSNILAERGDIDELRKYADSGNVVVAKILIELLVREGRIGELRDEVAAGTVGAAAALLPRKPVR
ncbi:hypothetical protein DLJ59_26500 [Micromonospora inaquosa]|uniref:Tetratricopeptide repeat protein n=2 Tax=Micromonospora inaquosa TaxID=2203716 RepID=A0A3N9WD08_9ACTN|nr:hypothetical protein DLJ59_26500 [Micromonospora inaquosa]